MGRPNRTGCDDGDLPEGTNDVRVQAGDRMKPTACTVVKVENGWLITVFFTDGRKARHVASSPEDAGRTVRGQLARVDFDWIPSLD